MSNTELPLVTANATHSIAFVAIGDEFVVSCFPLVNGEADTDREIFVRDFSDADVARRFYTSKTALLSCKAAAFDDEIDHVYRARSSLESCLYREIPNEARILCEAIADLELCTLARRNDVRESRKANAIRVARETLDRRMTNLAAKIAEEATKRASMGQP